jgi:rSAM/selenodomain-associated transferase 1
MICVMLARAPSAPGKTRLTRGLTDTRARELREALLLDTAQVVQAAGMPLVIAVTPDGCEAEVSRLVPAARVTTQRGGDLGERMRLAIDASFATSATKPDKVALIGSDLPTLPHERLFDACDVLGTDSDLVLGPSEDGGFYLIAARAPLPPQLFDGVEWSTATVFERVLDNARAAALTVGVLPVWWDVDAPEDLSRVLADPRPHAAAHVRAWRRHG